MSEDKSLLFTSLASTKAEVSSSIPSTTFLANSVTASDSMGSTLFAAKALILDHSSTFAASDNASSSSLFFRNCSSSSCMSWAYKFNCSKE